MSNKTSNPGHYPRAYEHKQQQLLDLAVGKYCSSKHERTDRTSNLKIGAQNKLWKSPRTKFNRGKFCNINVKATLSQHISPFLAESSSL